MTRQKRTILFTALFIFIFSGLVIAAERVEWKDDDKDGRKESQYFYDGDKITKVLMDKNGDGKIDRWIYFKNGKRATAEMDTHYNGNIDTWIIYDPQGVISQTAKDTNHDGKPDQFQTFLKGRNLAIKEYDRNFDGKIDKRALMRWDQAKKITTVVNGNPSYIPNPGYTWIWKEEDSDFDGKIDSYQERGNKNPSTDKIGKEIDPLTTKPKEQSSPSNAKGKESKSKGLIDQMNEKYGLN